MLPNCHVCTEMQWNGHPVRMRLRPRFTVAQQFTMVHGSCCCSSNHGGSLHVLQQGGLPGGVQVYYRVQHACVQLASEWRF